MRLRRTASPAAAAARSGFSPADRLEQDPRSPSSHDRPRCFRRRPDPLAGVFGEEIVPRLEASPTLRPIALFEQLMRRRPDRPPSIRRTLERLARAWRAMKGLGRDVVFRHKAQAPGRLGLSDVTDAAVVGVTISGVYLRHSLYHFRLAYSGFKHVDAMLGRCPRT